jgi:hypothetical protein
MEQSPSWETDKTSASQEISGISWNPKVHYYFHKSLPPVLILSHINPVHAFSSHFLNIHFNPSTPKHSWWSLAIRYPRQNPVCTSSAPIHVICPILLLLLAHTTKIYTWCPGGDVPDFVRMFLKLNYTDITKNTYNRYGDNGERILKVWRLLHTYWLSNTY